MNTHFETSLSWFDQALINLLHLNPAALPGYWPWVQALTILVLALTFYGLIKGLAIRYARSLIIRSEWRFGSYLIKNNLLTRVLRFLLVIMTFEALHHIDSSSLRPALQELGKFAILFCAVHLIYSLLNASFDVMQHQGITKKLPIKSLIQLVKLITVLISIIIIISILLGKSPMYLLSGIGALSAVLLLVFKDSLLGLVAGIQLTAHKMVELGDWIEIDGADGEVIDITLQTVKIRNWDNTISTVPAYQLISQSMKNWTPMSLKGRRIKRAVYIDIDSVRFISEAEMTPYTQSPLLGTYMHGKISELAAMPPSALGIDSRRLTNVGTFRAYILRYLQQHPEISSSQTIMVRQLESTARGLPLELYCFTSNTAWEHYESVQADIFDHLIAVMPEFNLKPANLMWPALEKG
ncbi:mechanosensitive ion channel family protein [Pokkaliibacter sp. CJK22405]|uniref:mechanosensitive ion channel family protein n=1 Tax=Pokkaliibacter sp. CJK22405 TaxID=3384615 RepID=UPI003985586B